MDGDRIDDVFHMAMETKQFPRMETSIMIPFIMQFMATIFPYDDAFAWNLTLISAEFPVVLKFPLYIFDDAALVF